MAFVVGEAVGTFLICLVIAIAWLGAAWKIPFLKRRQDLAHYIAFALGLSLMYVSAQGSGGISAAHLLGAMLLAIYLGVRYLRRLKATN